MTFFQLMENRIYPSFSHLLVNMSQNTTIRWFQGSTLWKSKKCNKSNACCSCCRTNMMFFANEWDFLKVSKSLIWNPFISPKRHKGDSPFCFNSSPALTKDSLWPLSWPRSVRWAAFCMGRKESILYLGRCRDGNIWGIPQVLTFPCLYTDSPLTLCVWGGQGKYKYSTNSTNRG